MTTSPVVEMRDITVGFPGVKALDGVGFRLLPGEVHALMGENGAGKSTLIKALTGVYGIDGGTIRVRGEERVFASPGAAQEAGIATVYQEVNLCPNLTVAENILLGREPRRLGRVDRRAVRRRAAELLARLNLAVDPDSVLGGHPLAVQQLVAIARAVDLDAAVLILDEPTSSLDADEVGELFRVIRDIRDAGVAVLFVSHFLDQVYAIADRVTILRNGKLVGEYPLAELSRLEMVKKMVGQELAALTDLDRQPPTDIAELPDTPVLAATGLGRTGAIAPVDLAVHPGEVLGLAGLLGSGRTELARLLFGADHADSGTVAVDDRPTRLRSPHRRHRRADRVLLGRPQGRGPGRRAHRARQHRARAAGPPRLGAAAARGAPPTSSSRSGSLRWTSARPTRTCSSATSPAATSRRCSWPAGSSPSRGC